MNFLKNKKNKNNKNDAVAISLPIEKEIYGIKIRKLPIGQYIQAINSLKNLPEILLKEAFPNMGVDEIIQKLKTLNEDSLIELAGNLMKTIPEQALKFVSVLLDCDYKKLYNEVSPKELLEILKEFWKVNDMTNFMIDLKGMVMTSKTMMN